MSRNERKIRALVPFVLYLLPDSVFGSVAHGGRGFSWVRYQPVNTSQSPHPTPNQTYPAPTLRRDTPPQPRVWRSEGLHPTTGLFQGQQCSWKTMQRRTTNTMNSQGTREGMGYSCLISVNQVTYWNWFKACNKKRSISMRSLWENLWLGGLFMLHFCIEVISVQTNGFTMLYNAKGRRSIILQTDWRHLWLSWTVEYRIEDSAISLDSGWIIKYLCRICC